MCVKNIKLNIVMYIIPETEFIKRYHFQKVKIISKFYIIPG